MKNLKIWHILGGIGLLGISLSNIIQYNISLNDPIFSNGLLFIFVIIITIVTPLFLIAGLISFVWYLVKAIENKKTGILTQVAIFIILALYYLAMWYVAKVAPPYNG